MINTSYEELQRRHKELRDLITQYDRRYYSLAQPEISDTAYAQLTHEIRDVEAQLIDELMQRKWDDERK